MMPRKQNKKVKYKFEAEISKKVLLIKNRGFRNFDNHWSF